MLITIMFNSHEIERLYFVEKWPATKIARHFGVSRVTIYTRLKDLGHKFTPGSKPRPFSTKFTRDEFVEIFTSNRGAVSRIAKMLGISIAKVHLEMEFHQIPKTEIHPHTIRDEHIENLEIGESVEFDNDGPQCAPDSRIYKYARRVGIRLAIRHRGSTTRVTRTPLFTTESVRQMYDSGIKVTEIADTFLADPKTIRKLVNG